MPYASFSNYWANTSGSAPAGSVEISDLQVIEGSRLVWDTDANFQGALIVSFYKRYDALSGTLKIMKQRKLKFKNVVVRFDDDHGLYLTEVEILGVESKMKGLGFGEAVGLRAQQGARLMVTPAEYQMREAAEHGIFPTTVGW